MKLLKVYENAIARNNLCTGLPVCLPSFINSDETIYLLFEPHTQTYIYIETHTHDHTFSLSAHAPTSVSRAVVLSGRTTHDLVCSQ